MFEGMKGGRTIIFSHGKASQKTTPKGSIVVKHTLQFIIYFLEEPTKKLLKRQFAQIISI